MDEREQVQFNLPNSLSCKKLHWIREFKFLSGARLRAAKAMYELLEGREHDLSGYRSLVYANRLWQHWVDESDGNVLVVEEAVIQGAEIVQQQVSPLVWDMVYGQLPE